MTFSLLMLFAGFAFSQITASDSTSYVLNRQTGYWDLIRTTGGSGGTADSSFVSVDVDTLKTDIITSKDSTEITILDDVALAKNLTVADSVKVGENCNYFIDEKLNVCSDDSDRGSVEVYTYNNTLSNYSSIGIFRARGSIASPNNAITNYPLGQVAFYGWANNAFRSGALIRATPTENYSFASNLGTKIEFYTVSNGSGTNTLALTIDNDNDLICERGVSIGGNLGLNRTSITTATYTTVVDDEILHVTYTATGTVAITLEDDFKYDGATYIIKDAGGNASSFNITITAENGTIDGAANATISGDYDSISIYSDGTNWFIF